METILLLTAVVLGALAFFEPCTIATHTLFAARAHQKNILSRMVDITLIWVSRSVLLIILFSAATLLTDAPVVNAVNASIVLIVMASVYLISRKIYIPVPHLEFFRLIPYSSRLPDSIKLGLTAPACTLPLLVILIVWAAILINTLIQQCLNNRTMRPIFTRLTFTN